MTTSTPRRGRCNCCNDTTMIFKHVSTTAGVFDLGECLTCDRRCCPNERCGKPCASRTDKNCTYCGINFQDEDERRRRRGI